MELRNWISAETAFSVCWRRIGKTRWIFGITKVCWEAGSTWRRHGHHIMSTESRDWSVATESHSCPMGIAAVVVRGGVVMVIQGKRRGASGHGEQWIATTSSQRAGTVVRRLAMTKRRLQYNKRHHKPLVITAMNRSTPDNSHAKGLVHVHTHTHTLGNACAYVDCYEDRGKHQSLIHYVLKQHWATNASYCKRRRETRLSY